MLTGFKSKLNMLFWGDLVEENNKIRNIDTGAIIRSYMNNKIVNGVYVADLQMMFSDIYDLVNSKEYLINTEAKKEDYELIYNSIIYYIDKAHKENDNEFFNAVFYEKNEISRDRLQVHFPTLDEWQLDLLLKVVNLDYTVPVDELEGYNLLVYIGRVKKEKEVIAI